MNEIQKQLALIRSLVGECDIQLAEDGFLSRGYVIDGGRLVFKFPRNGAVRYGTEIDNLNFIGSLELGVHLQKPAFVSADDAYLGVFGVPGSSLEKLTLTTEQKILVGKQLGEALKRLHAAEHPQSDALTLRDEIAAWTERMESEAVCAYLSETFTAPEREAIRDYFFRLMPRELSALGDKPVFSHGDLGDGNIFLDADGRVGIIDFNESGYLEEAADFMDIGDGEICEAMLSAYGADAVLREKVAIRRRIRPLVVLQPYLQRGKPAEIERLTAEIRYRLLSHNRN